MGKKELQVAAIENGTVIDHIPSEKTYEVARLLHLTDIDVPTLIGYNLPSKRLGKKGIIKITNKYFTDEEISRLSVIAPNVVLNIIKDYEVVEKKMVVTPNELHGIIKCNNPKCITNNEPMDTFFTVIDKEKGIVKCHYCDKEQDINNVELV
ncbi:aspartate carbamoyltransferase regulatory subunit [Hallella mizrahii]|uniref:Aspartate carbamoyltransferase regulatory chain n=1 Tax=Hallella mizrahii TaxID=2606637 RepID=A0A7K0KJF5_9BACT|nr:aspartate carbamoyltransferase regulatory subunit [Hallella mizrahii]MST85972.1 aspartate carbamoyltransferase regulatory subunit [Hallella mizrahii]